MYVVTLSQRGCRNGWTSRIRSFPITVGHCATVGQAVRAAQRAYPGWTAIMVESV